MIGQGIKMNKQLVKKRSELFAGCTSPGITEVIWQSNLFM
jgi:hypothetical protein